MRKSNLAMKLIAVILTSATIVTTLIACNTDRGIENPEEVEAEGEASLEGEPAAIRYGYSNKDIVFSRSNVNYAWGFCFMGYFMTADGCIYEFQIEDKQETREKSVEDIILGLKVKDDMEPICQIDLNTVDKIIEDGIQINGQESSNQKQVMVDAGEHYLYFHNADECKIYCFEQKGDVDVEYSGKYIDHLISLTDQINEKVMMVQDQNQ